MAEPLRPTAGKLYGKDNWILVLTYADITHPLVSEASAASALDITRIILRDSGRPAPTTNIVDEVPRYGDTQTFQRVGTTTWPASGLMRYAIDDQAAVGSDPKKLFEKVTEGLQAYLTNRRALTRSVALAAGQFVHNYPVEFGPSTPVDGGDGEAGVTAMQCGFAITGPPAIMVPLFLT